MPTSEKEVSNIRRRLIRAGFRGEHALNVLYTFKAVAPAIFGLIAFASGLYRWNPWVVFGAAVLAGYILPDFVLDGRLKARANQIRQGLPDVLDLLVRHASKRG